MTDLGVDLHAGQVVTANEFRSRHWEPGTLVTHPDPRVDTRFVLLGNDAWVDTENPEYRFTTEDFTSDEGYKLLYIA